jgi:hypothetical protein
VDLFGVFLKVMYTYGERVRGRYREKKKSGDKCDGR